MYSVLRLRAMVQLVLLFLRSLAVDGLVTTYSIYLALINLTPSRVAVEDLLLVLLEGCAQILQLRQAA